MRAYLERITPQVGSSVLGLEVNAPRFPAPWHFHAYFELTYIRKGAGVRHVGDSMETFAPGDLVLIGPNVPHRWESRVESAAGQSERIAENGASAQALVVQWPQELIPSGLELVAVNELLHNAARGVVFENGRNAGFGRAISKLVDAQGLDRYLQLLRLLDGLTASRYRTLSSDDYHYDQREGSDSRLNHILEFVRDNYQRKVTLAEAAAACGLRSQPFARFFQRMMNRTFFEYLTEYRIQIASQQLRQSREPVAVIAAESGFTSLPLFHRQFKKYRGTTPLRYRKLRQPAAGTLCHRE
ncbi:AraC family transcriptional regulator [Microbulbifer sp. Q7]|uniref:helix-turn-helix domain-containing protein n=1 Tax=Microbulbifer sp. Q7 TaxID=1785091 RepID=UPI0008304DB8|nr:AraC family transcriptional regulator [Microbulbifer sp. Q7]